MVAGVYLAVSTGWSSSRMVNSAVSLSPPVTLVGRGVLNERTNFSSSSSAVSSTARTVMVFSVSLTPKDRLVEVTV